jgi:hypothetical protein
MSQQASLFEPLAPVSRPKSSKGGRRYVGPEIAPLNEPREAPAFVRAMLTEYAAAMSCARRSKCMARKVTTSGDERRQIILDQMDAALRRCAQVELALVRRIITKL